VKYIVRPRSLNSGKGGGAFIPSEPTNFKLTLWFVVFPILDTTLPLLNSSHTKRAPNRTHKSLFYYSTDVYFYRSIIVVIVFVISVNILPK
jgi:hypothetical protein